VEGPAYGRPTGTLPNCCWDVSVGIMRGRTVGAREEGCVIFNFLSGV
jgi:hypothetical protein